MFCPLAFMRKSLTFALKKFFQNYETRKPTENLRVYA